MSNLMFRRKLKSINYPNVDAFDIDGKLIFIFLNLKLINLSLLKDEMCFKNLMIWLEDQKIRHYKIEDRKLLRDLNASNWNDDYYVQVECYLL